MDILNFLRNAKKEKSKTNELKKSLWWRQRIGQGLCYYCGLKFPPNELTMDHRIPLSRGGKTSKKNVVPSCKKCNTEKSNRFV